jgi:GGDEF domain-containing protein
VTLGRPDQLADLYSQYAVPGDHGTGFSAENWCVMPKLGNHLYLAIDAGPIHDEDGNLIAVVRDMIDQKRAEMALQTLAAKDGLTGLANRRCFDQVLQAERLRAQRREADGAIVRRRRSRQTLQRPARPSERRRVPASHRGHCRRRMRLGRSIWLHAMAARNLPSSYPRPTATGPARWPSRFANGVMALRIAHRAPEAGAHVTLSVGVATLVPRNDAGADRLLGEADQALYAAKRLGRNRVVCADTMLADFARLNRRKTEAQSVSRRARR